MLILLVMVLNPVRFGWTSPLNGLQRVPADGGVPVLVPGQQYRLFVTPDIMMLRQATVYSYTGADLLWSLFVAKFGTIGSISSPIALGIHIDNHLSYVWLQY